MKDIRGLEQWEGEAKEWATKAGQLKMTAGVGMVEALESWYAAYQTKKTDRNRREYLLWRLRLHLKHNGDPEFLQELDENFNIGLHDDEVGKTYWDIPPELPTSFTNGFNWRRDSGNALRGRGRRKVTEESSDDLEE